MNGLPGSLPVGQGRSESYLPERKIYLSRTTGRGFFRALNHMLSQLQQWRTHFSWRMESWGAHHLAKKSGNFGLKSNGKVIFRKFRSEIVDYRAFPFTKKTRKISIGNFHLGRVRSICHMSHSFTGPSLSLHQMTRCL